MADSVGLGPANRVFDEAFEASSSTSDTITNDGLQRGAGDGFIYHKVSKLDTLAGLAIRYHVTVSDIKRANGILSDNAMFAREHVKIPTGQLPVGEEAQVLFARLLSGYGRDASLNAKERKAPGTVSITQLPGSPSAGRAASNFGSEAMDDDPGTPYSRRSDKSSSEPGDVELMERSLNDSSTYGYGSDRVRRRTKGDSSLGSSRHASVTTAASQISHAAETAVGWLSNAAAAAQAALPAGGLAATCLPSAAAGRHSFHNASLNDQGDGSSSRGWQNLSSAIAQGSSNLVQKIKRAASQPALVNGISATGFADVADVVLKSSLRAPSTTNSGSGGYSSIDLLARGTGIGPSLTRKDTKGD